MSASRLSVAFLAAYAALCVWAGTASAEGYRYQNVPRDIAAAKETVIKLSDLGSASNWQSSSDGSAVSRVPRNKPSCPGPRPKLSDLVVTGDAMSQFWALGGGVWISSMAQVFQSKRMLEASWRREIAGSFAVSCARRTLERETRSFGRVTSFAPVAFPRMGSHTRAFRAFVRTDRVSLVVDMVVFSHGRTLSALMVGGVTHSTQPPSILVQAEQGLVSIMLSRGSLVA
jgi:hypothetical protein